ncbi:PDR/VanB family oxidoreductase [Streptomyces sp. NPDC101455]|uniref:PDR/VanB family oxidoreductase n=1 Tax=Streptomyces sp. NPDC101455 TaxID=3366142 RepID=UPI003800EC93
MSSSPVDAARVTNVTPAADGVALIEIEPASGTVPYPTGAHLVVEVLVGERPQTRCYSLVGPAPADGAYRVAVRLQPGGRGGSTAMHRLVAGDRIRISRPVSGFELSWGQPEYLLLAAGIGITPLLGTAHALHRAQVPVRLVYVGRSRSSMPFLDELSELLGDNLRVCADDEGADIDLAAELAGLPAEGAAYMCGPVGFMDAVRCAWREQKRPAGLLRFESFASGAGQDAQTFTVEVSETGERVTVPVNTSMLDALRLAGVDMMYDCQRGECGLCAVRVVSCDGVLDHRDVFLSDRQKATGARMCVCVSRVMGGGVTVDTGLRPDPERHLGKAATP